MHAASLRTRDFLALSILLVIIGAIYFFTIRPGQDWGGDFSVYIMEARNLVLGRPYHFSGYVPDAISAIYMPPAYPPLFPALLAPLYGAFGIDYFAFKLLVQVLLLAGLCMLFALARLHGLNTLSAFLVILSFGLSSLVLAVKESIISDGPYLFFAGLTLVAVMWIYRQGWDHSQPVGSALIVAASLLLAYLTRAIGLSLAAAFFSYELWTHRRLRLFAVLTGIVFMAGVVVSTFAFFDTRSYGNQFTWTPATYLMNVTYYLRSPASLWAGFPGPLRQAVAVIGMGLALGGLLRRVTSCPSIVEAYFIFSLLPALIYSSGRSDRYVLPLYPVFLIYIVEAFLWLTGRFVARPDSRKWVLATGATLLLLGAGANVAQADRKPYSEGIANPTFAELCAYVEHTGQPGDLFIFWNPRVLALYTERRTAWYRQTQSDAEFERDLENRHATYVIEYRKQPDDLRWLEPHVSTHPQEFVPVYNNADYTVYRVCAGMAAPSCAASMDGNSTSKTVKSPALPR